jgi:hypothetical protein
VGTEAGTGAYGINYNWTFTGLSSLTPLDYFLWDDLVILYRSAFEKASEIRATCTATTALGDVKTKSIDITVKSANVPVVKFVKEEMEIYANKKNRVFLSASAYSCNGRRIRSFNYSFEMENDSDSTWPDKLQSMFRARRKKFVIPKNTFEPGRTYVIVASVAPTSDPTSIGQARITLKTKALPLTVEITNGDRMVGAAGNISLTTTNSVDPNKDDKNDWVYDWRCEDWSKLGVCPLYSKGIDKDLLESGYV